MYSTRLFSEEIFTGSKHKINPTYLQDSHSQENCNFDEAEEETNVNAENSSEPSTSIDPVSRFKKHSRRVKPLSKIENVLHELEENRKLQQSQFNFFKAHMERSERQKDRFLTIMEKAFSIKRKHSESSDSD